ncbi:MAG TPA: bifunctional 4-hydroxy-2-oxoglutarate aldolase/2-dehydro-3-deoxy-phosphogluconate aldolase [Candidatus Limnocylindrales bacterium]|nr:bifunctional 4-hydroxy-2-oxoglutarate aldolase/2-dehydro-3-deoxy-phosphogluconate aldolase [Candidatus Limnocylindrales bacterium]
MARFDRLTVLNTLLHDGMVPLFYEADLERAKALTGALAEGGSHVLEFTNRGDFALEVFSGLVKYAAKECPQMIIGVGSIDDAATAALFLAHGANFVVGPTFDEMTARLCNRRKVAYMPGCGSLNEIARAEEFGAEIVKMFPGGATGGPSFVKDVLAPRPWSRIMPTGGVTPEEANLKSWFEAGVACVGMGSRLLRSDWIKAGNYEAVTQLTGETLTLIGRIRAV